VTFWCLGSIAKNYKNIPLGQILSCEELLCDCCVDVVNLIFFIKISRKILNLQHQHNNYTTPHMRVDPTHWGPLSCEELLCDCCDGVVYESNPKYQFISFTFTGLKSHAPFKRL
jgi:hypothetical protein